MKIIITFETENASFVENFEYEVSRIMAQAKDFICDDSDTDILRDTNGNKVGTVWRSTSIRPRMKG